LQACCPWPTLAPTPTDPSSSLPLLSALGWTASTWCSERYVSESLTSFRIIKLFFLQVTSGMELVRQIESYGSSPAGKVSRRVEIADCGQL
jgi:hypothetical protein